MRASAIFEVREVGSSISAKFVSLFNLSNKKNYSAKLRETYIFSSILLLAGCGGSSSKTANTSEINYQERTETFFSNISVNAVEKPNWVSALQMDEMGVVTELLAENENVYYYHFMTGVPSYELVNPIRNVKPATPMMREAAEEIFSELNNIFGVQFHPEVYHTPKGKVLFDNKGDKLETNILDLSFLKPHSCSRGNDYILTLFRSFNILFD